ncbi:MAG: phytanoyl-CoA dioxygenase family protein [Chitinophagales bacterium]
MVQNKPGLYPTTLTHTTEAEELYRYGVVVIPFLTPQELEQTRQLYQEIATQYALQFTNGMHMTLWHSDPVFKNKVKTGLLHTMQAAYERHFTNSRWLNNIFMVKQAHTTGEFAMHSDWSIVDETQYSSINVWITLQDVNETNGGLWVLQGSHHMNLPIRGGGALLPDFSEVAEPLKPFCVPVNARAGEAVLFYHKTVHGSYPNQSDTDRVVSTFSVIPAQAPLQIYFQKDENSPLEIHRPPDDFNYKYNNLLEDNRHNGPSPVPVAVQPPYVQKKIKPEDILPFIVKP